MTTENARTTAPLDPLVGRSERCDGCKFWERVSDDAENGECHRYPPVLLPMTLEQCGHGEAGDDRFVEWDATRYPQTPEEEWCGEFVAVR